MAKRASLLLLGLLLAAVVGVRFIAASTIGEESTEVKESRAVEFFREDTTMEEYKDYRQIRAYFLVPVDFSYEEAESHFDEFSESMKAEYGYIGSLYLRYYDDEAYLHDTPAAIVEWSPYLRDTYKEDNVEVGDYSKHTLYIEITNYDADYELDEEEKVLYKALQNYSMELTGKYIYPWYSTTWKPSDNEAAVFAHIAEQYQTTVERLIEIRFKATMRRLYNEETPSLG